MAQPSDERVLSVVAPQRFIHNADFELQCGETLNGFEIVFETYGTLNEARSNAVLICHALSGNHHAAGRHSAQDAKPGWWDACIGPGKAIDTEHFFVVSLNNLGGCDGSTGPTSINPRTGIVFGPEFVPRGNGKPERSAGPAENFDRVCAGDGRKPLRDDPARTCRYAVRCDHRHLIP